MKSKAFKSPSNRLSKLAVLLFCTAFLAVISVLHLSGSSNQEPPGTGISIEQQDLFADIAAPDITSQDSGPDAPRVLLSRYVDIRFEQLLLPPGSTKDFSCHPRELHLNLFPGVFFTARREKVLRQGENSITWIGKLTGEQHSSVILSVVDRVMNGSISTPQGDYRIEYAGQGAHVIREMDFSTLPGCGADVPEAKEKKPEPEPGQAVVSDSETTIDVLVAYTPAAATAVGGTSSMNALINTAVAETNTGYANSNITQRINLVLTHEVVYDEADASWSTTLNRLETPGDGYMDYVPVLRDRWGADAVVLIMKKFDSCGYANIMSQVDGSFADRAYCVISYHCATGSYSFAHELGHIMGARHDCYVDFYISSPYPYSHGYSYLPGQWRTIMAYQNECSANGVSCGVVNYWSNPDVLYDGVPMGTYSLSECSADNARTLNATAATVANFRQAPNITVNSPNGGDDLEKETVHNITWTASGNIGNVKIILWQNSTDLGIIADNLDALSGSYPWQVGKLKDGTTVNAGSGYKIWVRQMVGPAVYDTSDSAFAIHNSDPEPYPADSLPKPIPGTIEAEDYDIGGSGIAYLDTTAGNICIPPAYREDDVDIKVCNDSGGGYNVSYIADGEWLKYSVDVSSMGYYDIKVRISAGGTAAFKLETIDYDTLEAAAIVDYRTVTSSGGSLYWKTAVIPRVFLSRGRKWLKLTALADGFNINHITFVQSNQGPYGGTPTPLPGKLEAENYDTGGQGVSYWDSTPGNICFYDFYRNDDVDVENSPVSGPVINVGYIASNEWLEYTVDFGTGGTCTLYAKIAAPDGAKLTVEIDGVDVGTINALPSGQGNQDYNLYSIGNVKVPNGKALVKIKMKDDLFNLDYIQFAF